MEFSVNHPILFLLAGILIAVVLLGCEESKDKGSL